MSNLSLTHYCCIACGCIASRRVDFCCAYCDSPFVSETPDDSFWSQLTPGQREQLDASGLTGPIPLVRGPTPVYTPSLGIGSFAPPVLQRQNAHVPPGTYGYREALNRFRRRNHPELYVNADGEIVQMTGTVSGPLELAGSDRDSTQSQQAVFTVNGRPVTARDLPRQQMAALDAADERWYSSHELYGMDMYNAAPMPPKKSFKTNWTRFMRKYACKISTDDADCCICGDKLALETEAIDCGSKHFMCKTCASSPEFRKNHSGKCSICRSDMDVIETI